MTERPWRDRDRERFSAEEYETWNAFYKMRRQLDRALDAQLSRDSGISVSEYEILIALLGADGKRARVRELATATRWEKSRVSHQVARLERRGLVERLACPGDARASLIHLTSNGRRAVVKASPGHVEAIRRFLFDPLTSAQLVDLREIADRTLAALDETDAAE